MKYISYMVRVDGGCPVRQTDKGFSRLNVEDGKVIWIGDVRPYPETVITLSKSAFMKSLERSIARFLRNKLTKEYISAKEVMKLPDARYEPVYDKIDDDDEY